MVYSLYFATRTSDGPINQAILEDMLWHAYDAGLPLVAVDLAQILAMMASQAFGAESVAVGHDRKPQDGPHDRLLAGFISLQRGCGGARSDGRRSVPKPSLSQVGNGGQVEGVVGAGDANVGNGACDAVGRRGCMWSQACSPRTRTARVRPNQTTFWCHKHGPSYPLELLPFPPISIAQIRAAASALKAVMSSASTRLIGGEPLTHAPLLARISFQLSWEARSARPGMSLRATADGTTRWQGHYRRCFALRTSSVGRSPIPPLFSLTTAVRSQYFLRHPRESLRLWLFTLGEMV